VTGAEAAAERAEIQRRQGQAIKAALVPVWYWWAMAAGIVAIGAARDSGDLLVQAVTIPRAVLVMVVLTGVMIPAGPLVNRYLHRLMLGKVRQRPRTSASLSTAGRQAFDQHVAALQRIIARSQQNGGAQPAAADRGTLGR
jgi:hypothetical protein